MLHIIPQLAELSAAYQASSLVLFGSRARGDAAERSDIDLAAFGVLPAHQSAFRLALDELPTLLKIDIVFIEPDTSPALLAEIERDGVILYEAAENKT